MNPSPLPADHPLARPLPAGVSPLEAASALIAYRTGTMRTGLRMAADDDPDDDDEGDDDDDDADPPVELDPDTVIKVGRKEMKVSDLQHIAAREKREGKKAGATALLKRLGFDTEEAARTALAAVPKKKTDSKDDDADDEAARRATAREEAAAKREREADGKARRSDLRGALREHGVSRDDLDDAFALLDRAIDPEYDEDDLEEAIDALAARRPALFGDDDDGEDGAGGEAKKKPPRARIPAGRPRSRNRPPAKQFGAGGLERARQRGWLKDKDASAS